MHSSSRRYTIEKGKTPLNDAMDENNDSNGTARQEPENAKKQTTCEGIQQEEICMASYTTKDNGKKVKKPVTSEVCESLPPPSDPSALSQSPAESTSSIQKDKNEKRKKKDKDKEKFENKKSQKNEDEVFKNTTGSPPKKKTWLQPIEADTSGVYVRPPRNESSLTPSAPVDVQPTVDQPTTLRRSTRIRKEMPKPLVSVMWEESLIKSIDDAEKRRLKKESKLSSTGTSNNTENDMMPIASSTAITNSVINSQEEIPENEQMNKGNANEKTQAQPSGTNLSEWLKEATSSNSGNTFKNMNVARRDELYFSSIDSLEYAFYNSNEICCGYMRFPPRQTKRTAHINQVLKLVIISGEFNITTDGETACVRTGDHITIKNCSRYSIESIIDEIGVILFLKM